MMWPIWNAPLAYGSAVVTNSFFGLAMLIAYLSVLGKSRILAVQRAFLSLRSAPTAKITVFSVSPLAIQDRS